MLLSFAPFVCGIRGYHLFCGLFLCVLSSLEVMSHGTLCVCVCARVCVCHDTILRHFLAIFACFIRFILGDATPKFMLVCERNFCKVLV